MKIVVLAGGLSTERAVSLVTGACVCRALRENGHRAILIDLFLGREDVPADPETLFDTADGLCPDTKIDVQAPDLAAVKASRKDGSERLFGPNVLELCALSDIVFLGLHGQDGEDGRVQATFDLLGIRYTGAGYLSSGLAMDKAMTKRMMDAAGIPTPAWRLLEYGEEDVERLAAELPMPCVIKTSGGGSSLGVFLPEDRAALKEALHEVQSFHGKVLWEQRIYGRELTVGVLGERALPAVEILPAEKEFDYAAKYQTGGARELCPAPITARQQETMGELACKLHKTLGLEVYSRTDFLMDAAGKFWCLEVNSLPGMTNASLVPKEAAAAGMTYNQLCEEIVQRSYRLKRRA
ncbi:D-alanine--D-alanine ligase [Oscillibacter sp.]|uniref:D-alanine--D-alanine ligase family protein n=1 Tax=Oscillibacter sp. TaxID=1945593 RepID=UPI002611AE96|nr:D-alanine--D-alanine ligase [Oscillibacter sp.]MDD3347841.1 D-alanine--D-alanine ligase [Oscillibacter sp.]